MQNYKIFNKVFSSIVLESPFYIPRCNDCIHYKKNLKCKLFNNSIILARFDKNKCGLNGKYFDSKYFSVQINNDFFSTYKKNHTIE